MIIALQSLLIILLLVFLPPRIEEEEEDLYTEIVSLYQIAMMVVMTVLTTSSRCGTEGGKGIYR